jgi:hypothetical protein
VKTTTPILKDNISLKQEDYDDILLCHISILSVIQGLLGVHENQCRKIGQRLQKAGGSSALMKDAVTNGNTLVVENGRCVLHATVR